MLLLLSWSWWLYLVVGRHRLCSIGVVVLVVTRGAFSLLLLEASKKLQKASHTYGRVQALLHKGERAQTIIITIGICISAHRHHRHCLLSLDDVKCVGGEARVAVIRIRSVGEWRRWRQWRWRFFGGRSWCSSDTLEHLQPKKQPTQALFCLFIVAQLGKVNFYRNANVIILSCAMSKC